MAFYRTVTVELPAVVTDDARFQASISSESAVLREDKKGPYWEVLDHGPGNAKLGLLNRQGVVLLNHDDRQVIGEVVKGSAKVCQDKKVRCAMKLYPEHKHLLDDMRSGKLPNKFSVGYARLSVLGESRDSEGVRVIRFSFEPYEASILKGLEPADEGVGLNRAKPRITMNNENDQENDQNQNDQGSRRDRRAEENRVRNIDAAVDAVTNDHPEGAEKFRHMATEAKLKGTPTDIFNHALLRAIPGVKKASVYDCNIGMDERDINRWSLTRAIADTLRDGRLSGVEAEAHRAYESKYHERASGFWIPPDVIVGPNRRSFQRDMTAGVASQGGNFIQTNVVTPIIELFRNRLCCLRLGAQSMAGLSGNVAIPRQTGTATAYSLPETATLTKANQAIDQVLLTPHRVGAYNEYSKQLLLQSSVDVENFIRDDLMKVLAVKWDKLMIDGAGSNSEPMGILNTAGIGSVTFGAAATLAKMVAFETALANANADMGSMAYMTTPAVRAKLKLAPKVGTTFPIFIWEKGEWSDGSRDGLVNEYRACATNQIAGDAVFFGNWNELIQAFWGGYDVIVNPYSRDIDAVVRITVNSFGDIALRHAASFAVSSDSGAQ